MHTGHIHNWPRDVWCHCHKLNLGWTLLCEAHCPTKPHDPQDAEEEKCTNTFDKCVFFLQFSMFMYDIA